MKLARVAEVPKVNSFAGLSHFSSCDVASASSCSSGVMTRAHSWPARTADSLAEWRVAVIKDDVSLDRRRVPYKEATRSNILLDDLVLDRQRLKQ